MGAETSTSIENGQSSAPRRAFGTAASICALIFVLVLGVAAYFDASIRVLHGFEAIPYLIAGVFGIHVGS